MIITVDKTAILNFQQYFNFNFLAYVKFIAEGPFDEVRFEPETARPLHELWFRHATHVPYSVVVAYSAEVFSICDTFVRHTFAKGARDFLQTAYERVALVVREKPISFLHGSSVNQPFHTVIAV